MKRSSILTGVILWALMAVSIASAQQPFIPPGGSLLVDLLHGILDPRVRR